MSSYTATAINPRTGKEEQALFIDDYFGKHEYGVKFDDGNIYSPKDIPQPKKDGER